MGQPFVSIVVPTFRNPGPLRQTLESLHRLDDPNDRYEIVVVDDAPDAETETVADAFASGSPRARYVAHSHGGAARARNYGARIAAGEVIIFIDDDMLVPADLIARHLQALEENAPAVVSGYRKFAPNLASLLASTPFGRYRLEVEPRAGVGSRSCRRPGDRKSVSTPSGRSSRQQPGHPQRRLHAAERVRRGISTRWIRGPRVHSSRSDGGL